MNKAIKLF